MLELKDSFFENLALSSVVDLSDSSAVEARSYQVLGERLSPNLKPLVIKAFEPGSGGTGAVAGGGVWDTGRWSTQSADAWATGSHGDPSAQIEDANAARIRELQLNWLISEQALGKFFPKIHEVGELEDNTYLIRSFYPQSLATLVRTKVSMNPAALYNVISGIWTGLCFLHQAEINLPHGNVKLGNVLFGQGPIHEAPVFLCDAVETSETQRKAEKQGDFRNLGVILYQIVSSDPAPISPVEALVRADGFDWSVMGKVGSDWKDLAIRLLDEASYANFNPAVARQSWLDAVRPKKARLDSVPSPVPAPPAGPVVGGEAKSKNRPPEEVCAEIDALTAAGEFQKSLQLGVATLRKGEEKELILGRIEYCVTCLPDALLSKSSILLVLEEAANLGSASAALRLGGALIEVEPDESLSWLQLAAERGMSQALPSLAWLLEKGTPLHPADPQKALECFDRYRSEHPSDESDYLYAAMILRGASGVAPSEAIPILQSCHEHGHYKGVDLLAQCYATGLGVKQVDEKKAYSLFVEAWNLSKTASDNYYSASNNLGVCFASGFGVSRDMDSAKHYFRQGALQGHEASKKNLDQLIASAG